jgi:catalase
MSQNGQYVLAEKIVSGIHGIFGFHPNYRAFHAVGQIYRGTFRATSAAKQYTRAMHFQGDPIPVTVRYSLGGGDPAAPPKSTAGMATKFYLSDGRVTDLIMLNAPGFIVRTPEELLAFIGAIEHVPATGQPDPAKMQAFLAANPVVAAALELRKQVQAPVSFSKTNFHGIHAFRFINAEGTARFAKYHWVPDAGVAGQTIEELQKHPIDHLFTEMAACVKAAPVRYALTLEFAEPGDPTADPTQLWPAGRKKIVVGHLELVAATSLAEIGDPVMLHDPTRVTDGIELSDDPIVQARRGTYEVSVAHRTGGWHSCPFAKIAG